MLDVAYDQRSLPSTSELQANVKLGQKRRALVAQYSPCGTLLACGFTDGTIDVIDLTSG